MVGTSGRAPERLAEETARARMRPVCTCGYVLRSQTASTGLRCGLDYYKSSYIMRKFQLMQHFPEVHAYNACESWDNRLVSHELHGGFTFIAPRTGDFST